MSCACPTITAYPAMCKRGLIVQDMCGVRGNICGQPKHAVVMGFLKGLSYRKFNDFRANFELIVEFTFIK